VNSLLKILAVGVPVGLAWVYGGRQEKILITIGLAVWFFFTLSE